MNIQSLKYSILDMIYNSEKPLSVSVISERTSISESIVSKKLAELSSLGYIWNRDSTYRYLKQKGIQSYLKMKQNYIS